MKFTLFGIKIHLSVLFCAMTAFLLLIDRSGMMTAALVAAVIHEAGHLSYMLLTRRRPRCIALYPAHIKIEREPAPCGYKAEVGIALSGPLLNLIVCGISLLIYHFYPSMAVLAFGAINLALCGFQLLPITGLDGGDILKCLLVQIFPVKTAYTVCAVLSGALIMAVAAAGAYLLLAGYGNPTLILAALYLAALLVMKVKYRF